MRSPNRERVDLMKVPVWRLRALDTELAEMLQEADGRCSTAFALKLDDLRERLSPRLLAVGTSNSRIMRKHADQDGKGNPKPDEQGRLVFSTAEQQDKVAEEMNALSTSEVDLDDGLPKLRKSELTANGLATSGQRIANLRPILDTSLDEPEPRGVKGERSVMMPAPGRLPDA
jgi:hypothetical protein